MHRREGAPEDDELARAEAEGMTPGPEFKPKRKVSEDFFPNPVGETSEEGASGYNGQGPA